jgi:rhomboid family GlyGly-CTERM serine protease
VSRRLPVVTLLMLVGALLVTALPGASSTLIYDRDAILAGEIWRLFTGHWVHFSQTHLVYDLLALGIAGAIIEAKRLPHYGWLCLLTPWLLGASALLFEPGMKQGGGLSGLAVTAITYLALWGLGETPPWRWVCLASLIGVAAKTLFELKTGRMVLATVDHDSVVVSSTSHLTGMVAALLFFIGSKGMSWFREPADRISEP